jgi:hypothetical protein
VAPSGRSLSPDDDATARALHGFLRYLASNIEVADSPLLRPAALRSAEALILDLVAEIGARDLRLFVGHDNGADGRDEPKWEATVAEHKASNVHVKDGTAREDWIRRRTERDRTLALPDRILEALQINLRGGRLPPAESDGRHYVKLPINRF